MRVVTVQVRVKPGQEAAFEAATVENARRSLEEPGITRFDLLNGDEPGVYLLVEASRDAQAPAAHKETPHYKKWRETVEPMMAEPRRGVWHDVLFPGLESW